jgi:three-Cys-motif partner protein
VLFLDPYGMEVDWQTLKAIARTKAIDVWYLFSLSGLYRQATVKLSDVDDSKRTALNRILGSSTWEDDLYPVRPRCAR